MLKRYFFLLLLLAIAVPVIGAAPTFVEGSLTAELLSFEGEDIDTPDTRYLSQVYESGVQVMSDVVYGNNISVISGAPAAEDLLMDVYMPPGEDTVSNRPVWVVLHTGTFIPKFFNRSTTGSKTDSTIVNICQRLARMGYVAVAATYRQGWLATSPDNDLRLGSLLQAAYRGTQDARTAIRYLRKSVAEDGNPFGIDPDKIGAWGVGTGAYLSLGAATLDEPEEVLLDKFLNSQNFTPLADTALLGDFYATSAAPLCIPNHVGYSSDFDIAVNMGGAVGDISWIDGKEHEPAIVGFHATGDIFAPYGIENVFEPVADLLVIDQGAGARSVIEAANGFGNNDVFDAIPPECDPLGEKIQAYKEVDHSTILSGQMLKLGTDHFYPFVTSPTDGSPWSWWGLEDLQANIAGINAVLGTNLSADTLHFTGLLTNPTMSAERGNTYLDSVFMVVSPRAYYAFGLQGESTSVPQLQVEEVKLQVSPVPSNGFLEVRSAIESPMQALRIVDLNGAVIWQRDGLSATYLSIDHSQVPPGNYVLDVYFKTGRVARKVVFH